MNIILSEKALPPIPSRSLRCAPFHFSGYRAGLRFCAGLTGLVLLTNIIWTVSASRTYGIKDGLGTMRTGSCKDVKKLSLWLHFLINFLSTSLLATSNYAMQCLTSPSRREVDRAHAKGKWLNIGVPSLRNLRHIAWPRSVLWLLLGLSAVPLHLLYNTAVYSRLSSVSYNVYVASPELASSPPTEDLTDILQHAFTSFIDKDMVKRVEGFRSWQRMDNIDCIHAYGQSFLPNHGDLVLVTSDVDNATAIKKFASSGPLSQSTAIYEWICTGRNVMKALVTFGCDVTQLYPVAVNWTIQENPNDQGPTYKIDYCLSQSVEEHCSLQFSLYIMCAVIVSNAIKAICILLTLWSLKDQPLVTLGDAIQSFLQSSDPTTADCCIEPRAKFISGKVIRGPQEWHDSKPFWFRGASKARWSSCNSLCLIVLILTFSLLNLGLSNEALLSRSFTHLWSLGFGGVTSECLAIAISGTGISPNATLFSNILLANAPQAVLSFLFLFLNSLYTSILMTQEWFGYARERKYLRVSRPVGGQRSTYRLQLPYKYGIPLLTLSGILHWLVSQSLFLVEVQGYFNDGEPDEDSRLTVLGYSCISIISVIILGFLTVILGLLMGFRRYPGGMPLAGSCSAAISAACHQPAHDVYAADRPILWGVVDRGRNNDRGVGHCSFSSLPVVPPVEGERYAGSFDR